MIQKIKEISTEEMVAYSIKLNKNIVNDLNYFSYDSNIFDDSFFERNKESLHNFTYFCINYCKNSLFLSKIIEKLAFPTEYIHFSKATTTNDELNLLIGFYAETQILDKISDGETKDVYSFLEKSILKNCKSIKEENFKLTENELVIYEKNKENMIAEDDKEIIEDIFDCFKPIFDIIPLQIA